MGRIAGYGGNVLVTLLTLDNCEVAWSSGDHGTATLETSVVRVGSGSAKCVLAGVENGDYPMYDAITSANIAAYDVILCWARSSVNRADSDFKVVFDSGSGIPTNPETEVTLPALVADTWKYCHCTEVSGKELNKSTAAITVGLEMYANAVDGTVYLDQIEAAKKVAGIKKWKLDYKVDTGETTGFDSSGHKTFLPLLKEWSGSFDGYKEGAPLTIGSVVGLELQETNVSTQQWRGSAIITGAHPDVAVEGLVVYTYDFQGTWELMAPSA